MLGSYLMLLCGLTPWIWVWPVLEIVCVVFLYIIIALVLCYARL